MSEENKKPKVIHINTFMQGKKTPEEVQREALRKRCYWCGQPPAIRIKVFMAYDELVKRNPEYVALLAASNPDGPFVPTVQTKYGQMFRISDVTACDGCKVDAERAAARGPSWCIVEIERVIETKPLVQVPR